MEREKKGTRTMVGRLRFFFFALGEVIWWDSNVGGRITMLVVGWVSSYHHELHHHHRYSISIFLPPPAFHFHLSLRNNDTPIKSGVCFASRRFEEKELF